MEFLSGYLEFLCGGYSASCLYLSHCNHSGDYPYLLASPNTLSYGGFSHRSFTHDFGDAMQNACISASSWGSDGGGAVGGGDGGEGGGGW